MGLEIAKLLASRGATISLADINEDGLEKAAKSLQGNGKHIYTKVDVTQSASVDAWIKRTVEELGKIDGAANMAGILTDPKPVTDSDDDAWERTFAVNTRGVFNCIRAELRAMKDGSSIVSAASVWGQFGAPGNAAYCASKAAVIGLTRTAAKENEKVRVNCVSPGSVATAMSVHEDPAEVRQRLQVTAQKRRAQPIEIAYVVAFLLSDESKFVTGAVYNADGGWVC
ncbi:hypothetical protein AYO21_02981 [Fonsecaea monophora]|uniref:Uncharacterized protein n=1 Tax=Fonsecaea monophora TaxID=254056 RepID=A0A177FEU5_9EURO|nr:hypothetical protein AYO21_02981 [Fonsecaea monophora]KAH0841968.1 Cyclopentanol dehydrogenase [Fonsecaea pedrosoi]OAG42698.1 hypothetical protein AYO21_02981 [Fonsecaea monophora]